MHKPVHDGDFLRVRLPTGSTPRCPFVDHVLRGASDAATARRNRKTLAKDEFRVRALSYLITVA
jgi:hypothetical protein